jgi:MFS family permease
VEHLAGPEAVEPLATPHGFDPAARTTLLAVMAYQGLTLPLLGVAAPWISPRFGLDATALAKVYAVMSFSALVTFGAARLADRAGRRRTLALCLVVSALAALGAALSRSLTAFVGCELVRFSAAGALANSALSLFAEAAPDSRARAAAVAKAGMAAAAGGASLLVVMPLVAHLPHNFRWVYAGAAGGVALVPALFRWVPESARWEHARARGSLGNSTVLDVFARPWLRRTAAIVGASLLGGVEGAAVGSWSYYYGVTVVGVSPASMSAWSLAATAAGFWGFRLGEGFAERLGRIKTAVAFGLLHQAAALWLYLGPPRGFPVPACWLGLGLCVSAVGASASGTAKSTAGLELFPTPLRVTLMGYVALAGAVATGLSNLMISCLAGPLGGLSRAVALVSLSGVLSLVVFGLGVDETRGRTLEDSAAEPEEPVTRSPPARSKSLV